MDLNQIRIFLATSEELNFTRTAQRLGLSQPTVSRAIRALEDMFGGPLFRRERDNTHLTELGRLIQPYLASIVEAADHAVDAAQHYAALEDTPITIGLMCTIGPERIMALIAGLNRAHPGLKITLIDGTAAELEEWLLEGRLDIAICGKPKRYDERFHIADLYDEAFVAVLPADDALANQDAVKVSDLPTRPYVRRINCEVDHVLAERLQQRGVTLTPAYYSDRDDWVQQLVAHCLAISLMPVSAITAPDLAQRPLDDLTVTRRIQIVTVRGRRHSPGVGAVLKEARAINWGPLP